MNTCFEVGIDIINKIYRPEDQRGTPSFPLNDTIRPEATMANDLAAPKEDRGGKIEERKKKKTKMKTT
jgi:hypothetical protein